MMDYIFKIPENPKIMGLMLINKLKNFAYH